MEKHKEVIKQHENVHSITVSISFESLWPGFWDSEMKINSKLLSFSHLFLFRTSQRTYIPNPTSYSEMLHSKLCTTQLCELCCSVISNWGYGMCTHKSQEALLEAACLQHGSGMQRIVGPGSIWVPSCSPWPHPDKKQTNQQNKRATETDHMLELGKQ